MATTDASLYGSEALATLPINCPSANGISFWQMVYGSEAILPTDTVSSSAVLTPSNELLTLPLSLNLFNDEYDHLGRNISAQKRRQNALPWILVSYQRHRCHHEENDQE